MARVHSAVATANAVATLQAVGATTVAMEGLVESVKEGWAALKAKISPDDHQAILNKLAYISKMRASIADAKTQISQAKGDARVTKNVARLVKQLPVTASSGQQLLVELAAYRKRVGVLIRKAAAAKTPEEIKRTRQELLVEFGKKGNVAPTITFDKAFTLKLLDEMDALAVTIIEAGKLYQAKYQEGGKDVKVAQEGIALESHEDALSVALEGFFGVIGGSFLLLAMIVVRVIAVFVLFGAIGAFMGGAFTAAVGSALVGSFLIWASQLGLEKADDAILGE